MSRLLVISLCLILGACSTLKKTVIYSALSGGIAGAATGAMLSPNRESIKGNGIIFGILGAGIAAGIGRALYKDDPRNYKLKHMLLGKREIEIPLGETSFNAKLNSRAIYPVPLMKLPKGLKGKVGKQYLIKHRSKERVIKKDGKTLIVPAFDVYEHSYGEFYGK